jgi:DNA replication licensing factor MCM5
MRESDSGLTAYWRTPTDAPSPSIEGQPKDCPLDPYMILHDRCRFVDQQAIKLQEAPDMVPVGELPRHMVLQAERSVLSARGGRFIDIT